MLIFALKYVTSRLFLGHSILISECCIIQLLQKHSPNVLSVHVHEYSKCIKEWFLQNSLSLIQDLLKKCHQCVETIVKAKDQQAAEANKNASILLKELDLEKVRC